MPLGPISANCYILTDKKSRESAVIDPGDFNEALKNAVKDLNIKYILLTHGHFDHILGVCGLKEFTGAKVLIHKLDGDCLSDENKRELPVIALTADAMKGVREELISKGMSDFLTKPIVIGDLYKMLRKWLPEEKIC